jgi:ABC-2 type transport system permease protein
MLVALHAEWTKMRTIPTPGMVLMAAVVATVALSAAAASAASCPGAGCPVDPTKTSLTGVLLGQVLIAVLGVLSMGGEYSSGMIGTTMIAMPVREKVVVAKALTLAGPVLVAGAVAVAGSLVIGSLLLPTADGYPVLELTYPSTFRAAAGSVLYLGLIALLSLGTATIVRSSAAAIGIVLGLLFVLPILAAVVTDPDWRRRLEQISPSSAGLAIQATTDLDSLPIAPWAGLAVLAGWAAAAMVLGALLLRLRDA